jgi:hypothetical protein
MSMRIPLHSMIRCVGMFIFSSFDAVAANARDEVHPGRNATRAASWLRPLADVRS